MNYFKNKNIVITGAAGLIASNLTKRLMELEVNKIIVTGRNEEKLKNVFQEYLKLDNFEICAGDISKSFPETKENIDIIFHAASPIGRDIISKTPMSVIEPNIFGTINCLEFLKKQKQEKNINGRLFIFSSSTVYFNDSDENKIFTEEDTGISCNLNATNIAYAESKRMSETLAGAYLTQYGVDSVIGRFSYVYGYSHFSPNAVFYEFADTALKGEDIIIRASGLAKRDNIYIDDAVEGILCVCEKGESGNAYNISSGENEDSFLSVDEIANVIAKCVKDEYGIAVNVRYSNEKPRKGGMILDNKKLMALGWKPKWNMLKGTAETIKTIISKRK